MDIFEGKAAGYDSWFDENPLLLEPEAEAIRQVIPEFRNGVEIGVGTGIFASRFGIGTGVDPSPDMGSWAERRGIRFVQGEAEALPLENAAYDLALMVTVDCFLTDPEAAFREIHRVLQPGGKFVIAFLDRETELGAQYEQFKMEDPIYCHATFHSAAEITALLERTGFRPEERRQTVYTLVNESQPVKEGNGGGVFAVIRAIALLEGE